jgi:quinol monooxygenase YgiN
MKTGRFLQLLVYFCISIFSASGAHAQMDNRMIRLAKIEVDPAQLEAYNAALLEQMQTAVRLEPGVLTYYAVADKKNPNLITILEIYADSSAYLKHISTDHFKKYKSTVASMVKKLELIDVNLIGSAKQPGL